MPPRVQAFMSAFTQSKLVKNNTVVLSVYVFILLSQLGETVHKGTTYYSQAAAPPTPGTTYYSPEMQYAKSNRVQIRRPKVAIPIVNPKVQDIVRAFNLQLKLNLF